MMSIKIQCFDKEYELYFRIVKNTTISNQNIIRESYSIEYRRSNGVQVWHSVVGGNFREWLHLNSVTFKVDTNYVTVDDAKEHIQELIEAIKNRTYYVSKVVVE